MEKEKQLLVLCRQLIEQSLNWGDSTIWGNDDFEQLSEKIFEKTKVQLSVSTLKRIWGRVRYENFPTAGTLNALASFLGYESWRDFRQKNQQEETVQPVVIIEPESPPLEAEVANEKKTQKTAERPPYLQITGLIIVVVSIIFGVHNLYLTKLRQSEADKSPTVKFEATSVTDNLPNSVVFNYNASIFKSDSVFIQQSWDPRRRERVDGNGKQHTSIYYEPGYFSAKLIVDDEIKKQCIVFIKTKGWLGVIEEKPIPVYLSAKEIKGNGYMGVTDSTIRQKTGSPVFNSIAVKIANVREFKDIDPGNFTLETTLRNSSAIEASVCRQLNVVILGKSSAIIIPLSDKGCISDLALLTGEMWISGKNHDMSAFGCDFSKFQNLKCAVEKQRLKIYLNNKLILDTAQAHNLGEIVGLRYEFQGAGEVKDVRLSTPGKGNYFEKF